MNYQKLILVGNTTNDAQRQKSRKGDVTYTTFSVAVSEGRDKTTFFPVAVFGQYGETVAEYVTKGRQVLVEGRITTGQNGRFNVVANQVLFGARAGKPTPAEKAK